MIVKPYLSVIEDALRDGCTLHAFLSGGGLRVVRLERNGKLVGYGEHAAIQDALSHAAEDFTAGGRAYAVVYGNSKPLYLTGSSSPSDALDAWILNGHTMDACARDGAIAVVLNGYEHQKTPEGVLDRCMNGETVQWGTRGYTFESFPSRFPNGERCVSTNVLCCPVGGSPQRAWFYPARAEASASTFREALDKALSAPLGEV